MSDELLQKATRALRESEAVDRDDVAITRARILSSLREQERGRARKLTILIPLAAVLIGTTAFAATSGHLPRAFHRALVSLGLREPVRSQQSDPLLALPTPTPTPTPDIETVSRPEDLNRQGAKDAEEGQGFLGGDASVAPTPSLPSVPAPVPAPPSPLSLYDHAYRLHFIAKDHQAALEAWDAYLQSSPDGPLATEARYNRAIALVRLSRIDEARRALAPFARGDVAHGYRQSEAEALLEALR